jgi:membrane-bound lytic murein transglycosylase MltF
MASVFDGKNMPYAFEKISDFINGSGSGTALAPTSAEIIIAALEELKAKAKKWNANPDESDIPHALYAARELQKFVNRQRSDVANESAARIYVEALRAFFVDIQKYEKDLEAA